MSNADARLIALLRIDGPYEGQVGTRKGCLLVYPRLSISPRADLPRAIGPRTLGHAGAGGPCRFRVVLSGCARSIGHL